MRLIKRKARIDTRTEEYMSIKDEGMRTANGAELAQSVARWISNPGGVTRVGSGPGGGVPTVIISGVCGLGTLSLASSVGWRRKAAVPCISAIH